MEQISILMLLAPLVLLLIYVILNQFSSKTASKADDYAKEIVGELLEGLGKEPPKPLDPKLTEKDPKKD